MKNENLIERKIEKRYYRNFFNKFYDTLIAFKDPKHEFILATLDDIDDAFINTGKPVLQKLYRLLNTRKPGKNNRFINYIRIIRRPFLPNGNCQ